MNDEQDDELKYSRAIDRREFLRVAAGGALAASGVFGCGGGGNGGGGGGGGSITPDARSASIQAILDFVNTNVNQPRDVRLARALEFVTSRKEIIGRGLNSDGVWGIYPDGFPLMILDNREPEPVSRSIPITPRPVSRATDLPTPLRARFVFTMGTAFTSEVPTLSPLPARNGYSIVTDPGTIASLQLVSGDGIFYMGAHGGSCTIPGLDGAGNVKIDSGGNAIGIPSYGIWTASPYDPAKPNEFKAEIIAGQVGVGIEAHNKVGGVIVNAAHYWITPQFVLDYMQFGVNSLVWFGACLSNSASSAAFVAACKTKHAGLYVGWSNTVGDGAILASGKFIFDRLLGDNTTNPKENPPQRPFDYVQVWSDLHTHGLDVHPTTGGTTEIKYSVGSGAFGLLAPSIDYVLIGEFVNQARLIGTFGKPAANERAVLIGGIEASVVSWDENEIVVNLPQSGPGSAGDVEVQVRAHKSNVRRITEWDFNFIYTWWFEEHPQLTVSGPVNLRFRADVGSYRDLAHETPRQPLRTAVPISDFSATLTAAGQDVDSSGCTNIWSQSVNLVFPNGVAINTLIAYLEIDTNTKAGNLGLGFGGLIPEWFKWTVNCPSGSNTVPFTVAALVNNQHSFKDPSETGHPDVPLFSFPMTFQNDFSVAAGTVEEAADPHIRWEWPAVAPKSPPDPNAARSVTPRTRSIRRN